MSVYLHVRVVQGRNLPAADPNGFSDPYVQVKLNNVQKAKSVVIEKTLNPEWNFDCSIELERESIKYEIAFEVFDEDKLSANDFLGQVKFKMSEVVQHKVVGGFFELLNEKFSDKVGGDIYVIMALGDKIDKDEQRKAFLNGLAARFAMKNMKSAKK